MAAWMAYAVLVSALLLAGAWAAGRAVRLYRGPSRLPWAAAMAGSAAIPAAAWAAPALLLSAGPGAGAAGLPGVAATRVLERLQATASTTAPAGLDLDLVLGGAWALASAVLLVRLLTARLELGAALAPADHRELGGVRVTLTSNLGPAVTGFRRGRILLPRWLWELGSDARRLAVAHEREHLRAGDPWLLAGARLLVALMPWNLPLWWGLRRLRLAVETDCDRRVLQRGADPRTYGDLLLSVGERSRPVHGLAALAERTSFLERRIDEMTRATTKWRGPKAALAGAVALAAVAVACESPTPTGDEPDPAPTAVETAPEQTVEEKGETGNGPAFIPYDVPPKIANVSEVQANLQEAYPQQLKENGAGGKVVLWIYVSAEGTVEKVRVQSSSGLEALDEAAKRVAMTMEFKPAMNQDRPTPVWVQQPVTFEVE